MVRELDRRVATQGAEPTLYTIGHSRHPLETLVALLRQRGLGQLVDVRSHPTSKVAPQYRKDPLAAALGAAGVHYTFLGRSLGGRPEDVESYREDGQLDHERRRLAPDFQAGLGELLELVRAAPTVIMCAEEDPSHCHRRLLLAPALRQHGVAVVHLRGDGRLEPDEALETGSPQLRLF